MKTPCTGRPASDDRLKGMLSRGKSKVWFYLRARKEPQVYANVNNTLPIKILTLLQLTNVTGMVRTLPNMMKSSSTSFVRSLPRAEVCPTYCPDSMIYGNNNETSQSRYKSRRRAVTRVSSFRNYHIYNIQKYESN